MSKHTKLKVILSITFVLIGLLFYNKMNNAKPNLSQVKPILRTGTIYPAPKAMPNFELQATTDLSLIEQMKKKWNVVFFGYSYCPHLCPNTLNLMNKIAQLTNQDKTQFVFITIDPNRDTKTRLKEYLPTINPNFIGATGAISEIKHLTQELNIFVKDGDMNSKEHVDHSGTLLVINPKLELVAIFAHPDDPSLIAKDLQIIQQYNS